MVERQRLSYLSMCCVSLKPYRKEYELTSYFFSFLPMDAENPKDGTMTLTSHGVFVMIAFFVVSSLIL